MKLEKQTFRIRRGLTMIDLKIDVLPCGSRLFDEDFNDDFDDDLFDDTRWMGHIILYTPPTV